MQRTEIITREMDSRKHIEMWTVRAVRTAVLLTVLLMMPEGIMAQHSDFGVWTTVGAEKSLGEKWSVGAEGEFRTRDNSGTADRWSFGLEGSYKIVTGLKLSAGYTLLYDNNDGEITVHEDGSYNSQRPSYWGLRHRFNVSLTGSVKTGRFGISLRERWQYTYRPRKTTERYDYDNGLWEDYNVRGKGHNVLRSRLKVEYDIPGCRIDPYASAEMYNSFSLEKSRYIVGAEWKITRTHSVGLYYLYQNVNNDKDDDDTDEHVLGLSYRIKL